MKFFIEDVNIFYLTLYGGIAIGLIFDLYRALRSNFKIVRKISLVFDVIFWFLITIVIFTTINLLEKFEAVDELYGLLNGLNTIGAMKCSTNIDFSNDDLLDYLEYVLYLNDKFNCVKIVENAKNRLKFNGNYDIIIDSMLLRLIDSIKEE